MRFFVAVALLAAALGAAGATTVTVAPSTLSFKQALAACPGSLAAITIASYHVRVAEAPGVSSDTDDAAPPVQTIALSGAGGAANVSVNAKTHAVTAHNVKLSGKAVACIGPG